MTPGAPVPAVCPSPTIVMHDGAALVRERRGRSAALRDPRGRQEARGAVGQIDDRALRLARRPAQRPVRAGPSTTDPCAPRGRRADSGRRAAPPPPRVPRAAPEATPMGGLPDGRGRAGGLPAGRGGRPRHTAAELRRVEGAAPRPRPTPGGSPRGPRAAPAG